MSKRTNRFVQLDFELVEYKDDDTIARRICFQGHEGYQNIQFHEGVFQSQEVELVNRLAMILNEMTQIQERTSDGKTKCHEEESPSEKGSEEKDEFPKQESQGSESAEADRTAVERSD